ncbi:MAG: prepilin-type N-terminal cleavage/methylation domain-containing protein [Myxococcota bacterium]
MKQGFTLLEAMLAMAIMAVLATLALPSIQSGVEQLNTKSATQEVMHLIDFARTQATTRRRAYELVVTQAAGDQAVISINESSNALCSGLGQPGQTLNIRTLNLGNTDTGSLEEFENIRIIALRPADFSNLPRLCFHPSGRVLLSNGINSAVLPGTLTGAGAGEAGIVLRKFGRDRVSGSFSAIGPAHTILIPYNGLARFQPGDPLAP